MHFCGCLVDRSRNRLSSKHDSTGQDYMTEGTHHAVSLHPNPAYCTVDNDALQPHTTGSHDCHVYEGVSRYVNM